MVISSSQANDLKNRFAHLLQPIRDLTKNWNVDIANELEGYLEELESITITFDGGTTTMNFSEAAMVIQGSACVYSKKVEYLYSLVYQVLDLLSSKKKLQQAASVNGEGVDGDVTFKQQEDEEFLTLDDLKEHKNIDLKTDTDLFSETVLTVPRTPMALVPLEEGEKGEHPLISRTGEVLGSRNDFKMNTCNIHASGTMLLDMSHLSLLECSFMNKPSSTPFHANKPNQGDHGTEMAEDNDNNVDEGLPLDMSYDDNNGDADDDIQPPVEEEFRVNCKMDEKTEVKRPERKRMPVLAKTVIDPWAPMDPHQVEAAFERPFKKGKTFKIPATVQNAAKSKKRKKTPEKCHLMPIAQFCTKAYHCDESKFPSNPLKVPSFPEFEHLYWVEFKRRQALLKKEKKQLAEQGKFQELAEQEQEEQEENEAAPIGIDDDDDDDNDNQAPFNIPDIQGPVDQDFAFPQDNQEMDEDGDTILTQRGGNIISNYEDLVRYHVDNYLASAQQYAQITDLSKRVSEWEEKILPKLRKEETQGSFDIHKCGSAILEKLPDSKVKVPFRKIVEKEPAYQIARLFLATLQLANTANVLISHHGILREGMDTMELQILSRRRHFEELEEYRAPSLVDH